MTSCELTPSDLTFYKKDGIIQAGGFTINSCLMNNQMPLIAKGGAKKNKNINLAQHDKVSESYDQLAVPAGLLYIHQSIMPNANEVAVPQIEMCEMSKTIPDDLFDRLVELAEVKNAHRKFTRSKKSKLNNKHKKTKRL